MPGRPRLDPQALCEARPPEVRNAPLWVAYSGGADSTALLHALVAAGLTPRAVHVHHGLQPAADDWATHCAAVCRSLGVTLTVRRVVVDAAHPQGPEAAARAARYAAFDAVLEDGACLALAHHADDQAETVLWRILRGTGIEGLAGISALRRQAHYWLWRPLLALPRSALRDYLAQHRLEAVEDPHNDDRRYARVWLRREVLPLIAQRLDGAAALRRLADHAAASTAVLRELAAADLAAAGGAAVGGQPSVSRLLQLSPARRDNALRHWLASALGQAPDADVLRRIVDEVMAVRADAAPCLTLGGHELRRYRDHLWLMPALPAPPQAAEVVWSQGCRLALPAGCGTLVAPAPPPESVRVRFGVPGAGLRPRLEGPTRRLRNLFQEHGLPPWRRLRTPLLWHGGRLGWVPELDLVDAGVAGLDWRPRWIADDGGPGRGVASPAPDA
jgi:tRNA(Ile)-lysidine synthetase, N-terminal domain/tRNA(Ile)-lysidine synthetase, C-terminal domain